MDHFQRASTASSIDSSQNFYYINKNVQRISRNLQRKNFVQSQPNFYQTTDTFTNFICYNRIFQYFNGILMLNKIKFQLRNSKHKNYLTPFTLKFSIFNWFLLFVIIQCSFIANINATDNNIELSTCTRYQACSAEISQFPLLPETIGNVVVQETKVPPNEIESSGQIEGSGLYSDHCNELLSEKKHFPLYDEFVSEPTLFDFDADAKIISTQICQCPQDKNKSKFLKI